MSNKISYIKDLGNVELVIIYGYVGFDKWSVFVRDKKSDFIIKDFGIVSSDDAFSIYNSIKKEGKKR